MMNKFLTVLVITWMVAFPLLVIGVGLSYALLDYQYYIRIAFENPTDNTYNTPYLFTIKADDLTNGIYMQTDADDILLITAAGTNHITAMDLDSNGAKWRSGYTTIPPHTTTAATMYFGDASGTRNQLWVASGSDALVVNDTALINFSSGTEHFELWAQVTPVSAPRGTSGDSEIIHKPSNYSLTYDGTDYIFTVWQPGTAAVSPGTEVLTLNGIPEVVEPTICAMALPGHYGYTVVGGTLPAALTDNNTATYVAAPASHRPQFQFPLTNITVPDSYRIANIRIFLHTKILGGGGNPLAYGINTPYYTFEAGCDALAGPVGWTWRTKTLTLPSAISDINADDLNDARLVFAMSEQIQISEAYALITYGGTAAGTMTAVSIPATIGTMSPIVCSGTNQLISITDGVNVGTASISGTTLGVSTQNLRIGGFDGYIDDVTILGHGGAILYYGFDPLMLSSGTSMVSAGTISSEISGNIDAQIWFGYNPVNTTLSTIIPGQSAVFVDSGTDPAWSLFGTAPGTPNNYYSGTSTATYDQLPGMGVITNVLEASSIPPRLFWLIFICSIIVTLGFLIYKYSQSLFFVMIIANMITIFCAGTGIINWWLIPLGILTALTFLIDNKVAYGRL